MNSSDLLQALRRRGKNWCLARTREFVRQALQDQLQNQSGWRLFSTKYTVMADRLLNFDQDEEFLDQVIVATRLKSWDPTCETQLIFTLHYWSRSLRGDPIDEKYPKIEKFKSSYDSEEIEDWGRSVLFSSDILSHTGQPSLVRGNNSLINLLGDQNERFYS